MAKAFGGKRPQNLRHTLRRFMDYLGRHKIMLGVVGLLAAVSALAALLGTYMIRPIVNGVLENGSAAYLAGVVALTAGIYIVGALSTLGYTQLMVRAAQKILQDIRRDLFAHLQTLPLHYFDTNRKGDLMSLFTNDVDTISDALNNSFAVVIQTFIQVAGTLLLLFILNWRLSLLVVVGYIAMFWYINYSTQRSRAFYARQQASLGELDAYMEEMIAGHALTDADVILYVTDTVEQSERSAEIVDSIRRSGIPTVVVINKIDLSTPEALEALVDKWQAEIPGAQVVPTSAKENFNIEGLFRTILSLLPEGPAFYPKDTLTDKTLRFFASEIIREKILKFYDKEIPYCCEIEIESYKEEPTIDRISATIYVARDSQKGILIGHKGEKLKRVGQTAREDMEQFLGKKVFLQLFVKVSDDWRNNERQLRRFGYEQE